MRVDIFSTGDYIAGIIGGATSSSISDCINYGNVEGSYVIGGVSSYYGNASNCRNYGNIKGVEHVGGITGEYGVTKNCQNYGTVEATNLAAGGIQGQNPR